MPGEEPGRKRRVRTKPRASAQERRLAASWPVAGPPVEVPTTGRAQVGLASQGKGSATCWDGKEDGSGPRRGRLSPAPDTRALVGGWQ